MKINENKLIETARNFHTMSLRNKKHIVEQKMSTIEVQEI